MKKLLSLLGLGSADQADGVARDPVSALEKIYYEALRLAAQIEAHAQAAPYPHVAERLRRVAEQKRKTCEELRQNLSRLGAYVPAAPKLEIRSGHNHWQRMMRDVTEQSAFAQTLREYAGLLRDEAPEVGEFLDRLVPGEAAHREVLLDLLMRADPQAHQT
ncbi:MAG TPA: hypothetical protein VNL14_17535 [Candidatus Acidoferrales bacterium]|nr:hypothetical protein [Candidatus Acidoferrales bacterium]